MKKVTKWHMLLIGLMVAAPAGPALWWGFCYSGTLLDKILMVIAAVLLLAVSSIFFILFGISFGKRCNAFLYDKKLKREIGVEELTFEKVREFLDLYMGVAFHGKKSVSFSDFSREDFLEPVPKVYHPLFLMRILLAWMEFGSDEQWKDFAETDKATVDTIVDILFNAGEEEISSRLLYLRATYTGDVTEIKEFLTNNLEYFKGFILDYVKKNIHVFD
jgi:hypothetical protein